MYYLYALLDIDKPGRYELNGFCFIYKPYYIGKGSGKRNEAHKYLVNTKKKKDAKTRQLIIKGYDIKEFSHIFYYNKCESSTYNLEKDIISENKAHLYNLADGGVGGTAALNKGKSYEEIYGLEKSNDIKLKQSIASKGKKKSNDHKESLSKKLKENWKNEDYRKSQSKALTGRKMSDNARSNMSKAAKGRKKSKSHVENMKKAMTAEYIRKMSESVSRGKTKTYFIKVNNTEILVNYDNKQEFIDKYLNGSSKIYFTMAKNIREKGEYYNKKLKLYFVGEEIKK